MYIAHGNASCNVGERRKKRPPKQTKGLSITCVDIRSAHSHVSTHAHYSTSGTGYFSTYAATSNLRLHPL